MRLRVYVASVAVAASVLMVVTVTRLGWPDWKVVALFGILAAITEWSALSTQFGSTVSLSFAFIYAAILLSGPLAGAAVSAMIAVTPQEIIQRKPLGRVLFNVFQMVLSALLAGSVITMLGTPLAQNPNNLRMPGTWLPAALLAAFILATSNWLMVALAISLSSQVPMSEIWTEFRLLVMNFVSLTLLGLVLVQLMITAGFPAVFLLAVPFFVARQTLRVNSESALAFRDTVRSLVEVLEAKDPYTRGHSERVAVYAKAVAEDLGMADGDVHDIELAALLHDIGKVGIPASTLGKPGSLSASEFNQIQLHPITGSSILGDIGFLKNVVPLIEAHHERIDGSGYPHGLRGDAVPLAARVLAVADCFDAMTSDRAYRSALAYSSASNELRRSAGRKLDERCVDALLRCVTPERVVGLLDQGIAWETGQ